MSTRGWEHATPQDTRDRRTVPRSKYGAIKTDVGGQMFASKAEARRYVALLCMVSAGLIQDLKLQPTFELSVCGVTVGRYIADFSYYRPDGEYVVEDVKGVLTPIYRLKKRLVAAQYGIAIQEVR